MESEVTSNRLKRTMGVQAFIYALLGLFYSLPFLSNWLQDKLNFLSTNILNSTATQAEHSLFQAGAFVLVVFMLLTALRIFFDPDESEKQVKLLIWLNLGYAVTGLIFFIFSSHQMMHDIFVMLVYGGLGIWTWATYRKQPQT